MSENSSLDTLKAIIVDDEEQHHAVLGKMIDTFCPNLSVAGHAYSVKECIELIQKHEPQLIFLDVEMPEGNGFTLFDSYPEPDFEVIFTTAFDIYAINAIKYAALDYLLKPINIGELEKAVARARKVISGNNLQNRPKYLALKSNLQQSDPRLTKVALPSSDGIDFVQANSIIRVEADRAYAHFHLDGGRKIIVSKPLKDYESLLEACRFFRIHKSHMINLDHLEKYVKGKGGYVIMKDGSHVDVSVRKKEELLRQLM